jgi:hypothetical protein
MPLFSQLLSLSAFKLKKQWHENLIFDMTQEIETSLLFEIFFFRFCYPQNHTINVNEINLICIYMYLRSGVIIILIFFSKVKYFCRLTYLLTYSSFSINLHSLVLEFLNPSHRLHHPAQHYRTLRTCCWRACSHAVGKLF